MQEQYFNFQLSVRRQRVKMVQVVFTSGQNSPLGVEFDLKSVCVKSFEDYEHGARP